MGQTDQPVANADYLEMFVASRPKWEIDFSNVSEVCEVIAYERVVLFSIGFFSRDWKEGRKEGEEEVAHKYKKLDIRIDRAGQIRRPADPGPLTDVLGLNYNWATYYMI
ncbi:chemotaxis response regulator protein-glutamatemethylesterase [Striga asiatica]|uniref:Chemotaxis response regulator protein-glutamatemethylesterase n=1 Tax=Striga asiatica TaxID=4170 RepID=A0A5A7NYX3_STRAF|nr:chemotaxis response regulator protein-glutamatemethylesterase [Striga asiatica]